MPLTVIPVGGISYFVFVVTLFEVPPEGVAVVAAIRVAGLADGGLGDSHRLLGRNQQFTLVSKASGQRPS